MYIFKWPFNPVWRGLSTHAILSHLDHCNTWEENMIGWKERKWGEKGDKK